MPFWSFKKSKREYKRKKAPKNNVAKKILASSDHTESTLSITDTVKAYEEIIGHRDTSLAKKDDKIIGFRQEIDECQEKIAMLRSVVKQLEVDMVEGKKRKIQNQKVKRTSSYSEDDDDDDNESSSDSDEDDVDEEEEWSNQFGQSSEVNEKISIIHVDDTGSHQPLHLRTSHLRHSTHKNSNHSRRSLRRDSYRSHSVNSSPRHSIHRYSIHSRQSIRGCMDGSISIISPKSLQPASLTIRSLPREIQLTDEEEDDDFSFYHDSFRKPDNDS